MRIRSVSIWSVVLATTIVGAWVTASNAADDPAPTRDPSDLNLSPVPQPTPRPPLPPGPPIQIYQQAQQLKGQADIAAKTIFGARPRTNLAGNIRTAAEAVRDAKGDEAKSAAQRNLSELLGKYFDEDTKRREQELTQIEERLAKLRELLERRRAKKQDILDLQMKVALNEADGLGFYDSEHSAGPKFSNSFFRTMIDGMPAEAFGGGENPFVSSVKSKSGDSVPEPKPEPKKSKSESKSSISR